MPARPKRSRRRTLLWVGVASLLVEAVVLIAVLSLWGSFDRANVLDVRQAEAGVQEILSDPINGYGANNVTSVTCNDGNNPVVERNEGFTCQVMINGAPRQVLVVFRDDAGTYEVDGPR